MKKLLITIPALALFACGGSSEKDNKTELPKQKSEAYTKYELEQKMKDSVALLPAKTLTFDEALQDTMEWEHKVVIEGYIHLATLTSINEKSQSVNLYGRRNQQHGTYIYTNMPVGTGNNEMKKLPEKYLASDVSILDSKGTAVNLNERVKLSGKMYTSKSYTPGKRGTTYFTVTDIEKIPEASVDYAALNWPKLDLAGSKKEENYDKEFMMEGKIEVPMFVLTGSEMTVDLVTSSGDKITIKIGSGTGASQMENLVENWTPKDVKVHNNKGGLVNLKQKVKVYGTLGLDGLHVEDIAQ